MSYKSKLNKFTGKMQVVLDDDSLVIMTFKEAVSTAGDLPSSGNTKNDARFTNDTGHLYVWSGTAWVDQGDVIDLEWGAITGTLSDQTDLQTALNLKANATAISNVDNTSDADKPISTATQTALDEKIDEFPKIYTTDALQTLLSFDGVDGATTFTDAVTPAKTVTLSGGADLSNDYSKFGVTSLSLDGTFSQNATVENVEHFYDNNVDKITLDMWVKFKSTPPAKYTLFSTDDTGATGKRMYCSVSGTTLSVKTDGAQMLSVNDFSITDTSWHHITFVRTNGTSYPAPQYTAIYLDGVLVGSQSYSTPKSHGRVMYIGSSELSSYESNYSNLDAYINEFRINFGDTFGIYSGTGNFEESFELPDSPGIIGAVGEDKMAIVEVDGTLARGDNTPTEVTEAVAHKDLTNNPHAVDATDVGLGNVDNTSDADKPVSTAQQTALNLKADATAISNVDNTSDADKPISDATQTALDDKVDTSGTPVATDYAKFTDADTIEGRSYSEVKSDLSLDNVDNTSDLNKPISTATQTALDTKLEDLTGKKIVTNVESATTLSASGTSDDVSTSLPTAKDMVFDGSTNYLTVGDGNADFQPANTEDFIISFNVRFDTLGTTVYLFNNSGNPLYNQGRRIIKNSSDLLTFVYSTNGANAITINSTYTFTDNAEHNVQIHREAGYGIRFFVDGVYKGTGADTGGTPNVNQRVIIGADYLYGNKLHGVMSEYRFRRGVALSDLWDTTSTYTVPSVPYTSDATYRFLLHFFANTNDSSSYDQTVVPTGVITYDVPGAVAVTSASTTEGVITDTPDNKCPLRLASNHNAILDDDGNQVYGRLTESAGVWTLSYYIYSGSSESAYTFASSTDIEWAYKQRYNLQTVPEGFFESDFSDASLGNVDNTSDADKPVSTAQQTALNLKADKTNVLELDNTDAFTPDDDYEPATKKYVDDNSSDNHLDSTPGTDLTVSGLTADFTAGESLAFGDMCYMKSDGKYWKADADASSTAGVTAMATETISADASGTFLLMGIARDDSWANTVGGAIYLDTTAGAFTQTAPSGSGDIVQTLGIATHADRIYFKPELSQIELS